MKNIKFLILFFCALHIKTVFAVNQFHAGINEVISENTESLSDRRSDLSAFNKNDIISEHTELWPESSLDLTPYSIFNYYQLQLIFQLKDLPYCEIQDNTFAKITFQGNFPNLKMIYVADTYYLLDKAIIYQLEALVLEGNFPMLEMIIIRNCPSLIKIKLTNCPKLKKIDYYSSLGHSYSLVWPSIPFIYQPIYNREILCTEILSKNAYSRKIEQAKKCALKQYSAKVKNITLQIKEKYINKFNSAISFRKDEYNFKLQEAEQITQIKCKRKCKILAKKNQQPINWKNIYQQIYRKEISLIRGNYKFHLNKIRQPILKHYHSELEKLIKPIKEYYLSKIQEVKNKAFEEYQPKNFLQIAFIFIHNIYE